MRLVQASVFAIAIALVASAVPGSAMQGQDQDRVVPGGGITAAGWKGRVPDANSLRFNHTVNDSKFAQTGDSLTLNIGPAAIYWNPANTGSGDYTVKATFTEPTYMTINTHPHPYGLFIGGSDLEGDGINLMYCLAYGNGTFIVRGFLPAPQPGGPAGTWGPQRMAVANAAVNKAEGVGKPVKQDIAMSVKGETVSCSINGTAVWSAAKADVTGAGKLKSTDGIAGIRVSHNVDLVVSGWSLTKG